MCGEIRENKLQNKEGGVKGRGKDHKVRKDKRGIKRKSCASGVELCRVIRRGEGRARVKKEKKKKKKV